MPRFNSPRRQRLVGTWRRPCWQVLRSHQRHLPAQWDSSNDPHLQRVLQEDNGWPRLRCLSFLSQHFSPGLTIIVKKSSVPHPSFSSLTFHSKLTLFYFHSTTISSAIFHINSPRIIKVVSACWHRSLLTQPFNVFQQPNLWVHEVAASIIIIISPYFSFIVCVCVLVCVCVHMISECKAVAPSTPPRRILWLFWSRSAWRCQPVF